MLTTKIKGSYEQGSQGRPPNYDTSNFLCSLSFWLSFHFLQLSA